MTTLAITAVSSLILTFILSASAVVLACFSHPRRWAQVVLLALVALIVSTMGVTAWTPFGFFPEVGWTNGEISLRSKWLFLVPLTLGATALAVMLARRLSRSEH